MTDQQNTYISLEELKQKADKGYKKVGLGFKKQTQKKAKKL